MAKSVEQQVEDLFKCQLRDLGIKFYSKNDTVNFTIDNALNSSPSKTGGNGNNYPDIKLLLITDNNRQIPVMIEVKGRKGDLVSFDKKTNEIQMTNKDGQPNYKAIKKYAVNGAVHYANAILEHSDINEVIAIGINGYYDAENSSELKTEFESYYISKKLYCVPRKIGNVNDFTLFKQSNLDKFTKILDNFVLTPEEKEKLVFQKETDLEVKVKAIHQRLYEDPMFSTALETNQKLYLFCGLIMAGMKIQGIQDLDDELKGNNSTLANDGISILNRIKIFLNQKKSSTPKVDMIIKLLETVFLVEKLWRPVGGESKLKTLYKEVKQSIIPILNTDLHIDFTGKIFNSLTDWINIENDHKHDVVLTPRYVTQLMVKLARTNKDSLVWDSAMGSAGFLVSAMEAMIEDAKQSIQDADELNQKINDIKNKQLLGIEILGNVFTLAVLNMILMGDGSSNLINMDSFEYKNFPFIPNVFLLNPPYSANGSGFNFVEKALEQMTTGYACILIKESAAAGNGLPYTKRILEKNTLIASIHMPNDLFKGSASVQTAIYLFKIGECHNKDNYVTFVDMSNDGYTRSARGKSSQEVNLRDTDNAKARYEEVVDIILNKKTKTSYYTEVNGLVIKDTITLNGNDWTFAQHNKIDNNHTIDDFKKTVKDFLSWKVSQISHHDNDSVNTVNSRLQQLEDDFVDNGCYFKEFRIGDLFDIHPTKSYGYTNAQLFKTIGDTPVVVNSSKNNGIGGRIGLAPTEKANMITFSDTTTAESIFVQDEMFIGYSHVQGLYPYSDKWTKRSLMYLAALFRKKAIQMKFDYNNKFNRSIASDIVVSLPVNNLNQIAFEYMENYIQELEQIQVQELKQEQIRELNAYIKVIGLNGNEQATDEK